MNAKSKKLVGSVGALVLTLVLGLAGCASTPRVDTEAYGSVSTIGVMVSTNRPSNFNPEDTMELPTREILINAAAEARKTLEQRIGTLGGWQVVSAANFRNLGILGDLVDLSQSEVVVSSANPEVFNLADAQLTNTYVQQQLLSEPEYPVIDWFRAERSSYGEALALLLPDLYSQAGLDGMALIHIDTTIGRSSVSVTVGDRTLGDVNLAIVIYLVSKDKGTIVSVKSWDMGIATPSLVGVPLFPDPDRLLPQLHYGDIGSRYVDLVVETVNKMIDELSLIIREDLAL